MFPPCPPFPLFAVPASAALLQSAPACPPTPYVTGDPLIEVVPPAPPALLWLEPLVDPVPAAVAPPPPPPVPEPGVDPAPPLLP